MSSKIKTTSQNKDGQPTLVPKLRFPEFRNAEGWCVRKLNELLFETKQRNTSLELGPNDVLSVSGEYGCVNQIEFMGRSYAGASVKNYHIVEHGDIVYTKSPLKKNPYGIIKENKGKRGIVSTLYAVYRPLPDCSATYLDHFFSRDYNVNSYLQPIVKKGPKNDMKVNNADVLKGDICIPKLKEQQKIADCLSSADNIIAAQICIVDALKNHKKGLMLLLFPREGETQPRFRFPEFRNAPEWVEKNLEAICRIQRGKFSHRPRNDPRFFGGKYPFIQTGDVVKSNGGSVQASQTLNEKGLSVSKLFKPPIVLITIAANIGDTGLLDREACFTDSVVGLIPNKGVSPIFLELAVRGKKNYLNKIAPAAAQKNINNEILSVLPIMIPELEEQQRIAACFSSLDDLINAQTLKLEAIKTHKAGLIQQLVPSPEFDL